MVPSVWKYPTLRNSLCFVHLLFKFWIKCCRAFIWLYPWSLPRGGMDQKPLILLLDNLLSDLSKPLQWSPCKLIKKTHRVEPCFRFILLLQPLFLFWQNIHIYIYPVNVATPLIQPTATFFKSSLLLYPVNMATFSWYTNMYGLISFSFQNNLITK